MREVTAFPENFLLALHSGRGFLRLVRQSYESSHGPGPTPRLKPGSLVLLSPNGNQKGICGLRG
jgi:hypothetical protein